MKKSTLAVAITLAAVAHQASAAGFIEDSATTLGLRNFYIDRNDKNTAQNNDEVREWGQGFILNYTSGFTEGTVGFGVDAIGLAGVRLDGGGQASKAGRDRKAGQLFPLEHDDKAVHSYGKAGITGKARVSKTVAQLGTLQPKLPVVTFNDGRLLPQTFEGGQVTTNDIDGLTLVGGQLESTKTRSSTNDVRLKIGGATKDADTNKYYYAGGDYKVNKDLTLQYYYGNLDNFYKQHFLGLVYNWALPVGALKTDLRYFNSSSDGKNGSSHGRLDGYKSSGYWKAGDNKSGEVDNRTWSALFTYNVNGHAISAGYQQLSGDSDIPFLNQGDGSSVYLITDRQIGKFVNAGERTWLAEYGYDFASLGLPGLKATATYLSGDHIDAAKGDNKEWERDFRIDYVLQSGPLKGVALTWRNASLRGNDSTDQDENRLIVSYSLPLL